MGSAGSIGDEDNDFYLIRNREKGTPDGWEAIYSRYEPCPVCRESWFASNRSGQKKLPYDEGCMTGTLKMLENFGVLFCGMDTFMFVAKLMYWLMFAIQQRLSMIHFEFVASLDPVLWDAGKLPPQVAHNGNGSEQVRMIDVLETISGIIISWLKDNGDSMYPVYQAYQSWLLLF